MSKIKNFFKALLAVVLATSSLSGVVQAQTHTYGHTDTEVFTNSVRPSLDLNFLSGVLDSRITFTRAAATATYFDSTGTLQTAGANVPRFDYDPSTAVWNYIRNNTMQGAAAGSPGTIPTNWSASGFAGLTQTVVGSGTANGVSYIDIRWAGTTGGVFGAVRFETATLIGAVSGQTWAQSSYLALVGGSNSNVTHLRQGTDENTSVSALVRQNFGVTDVGSLTNDSTRWTDAFTLSGGATVAYVRPWIQFNWSNGVAVDITLRIGMPQLELASSAGPVVATSGVAAGAYATARGLLVEEQRTNSIRNSTATGAINGVIGSGGVAPTNWSVSVGTTTGLTRTIVGTGTENGISYLDVRLDGTAVGAGIYNIVAETISGVAALQGQTWTGSFYWRLVGGSLAGLTSPIVIIQEQSAALAFLANTNTVVSVPTAAALSTKRIIGSATLGNAATAYVRSIIQLSIADTAAIDITLRIGLPQLELGAFATSVIPTSTVAVTRNADQAVISTLAPWFNAAEGTIVARFAPAYAVTGSAAPTGVGFDDGTSNQRIQLRRADTSSQGNAAAFDGGVAQANIFSVGATWAGSADFHTLAFAYKPNDFSFSLSGAVPVTDSAGTVPAVTRVLLGGGGAGSGYLNGWLQRLTYYTRRLLNSLLPIYSLQ